MVSWVFHCYGFMIIQHPLFLLVASTETQLSGFTFMHWRRKCNPLQCSCLEYPREGEAWWAAFYGVTQGQTWLKWLSSSKHWVCLRICLFLYPQLLWHSEYHSLFLGWRMRYQPNAIRINHFPEHSEVFWCMLCDSSDTLLFPVFFWCHEEVFFISSGLGPERWKTEAASSVLKVEVCLWQVEPICDWSQGWGLEARGKEDTAWCHCWNLCTRQCLE